MKPVVLAPEAQAELEGAAEWYEGRREGLASGSCFKWIKR
jgi:hypothetical protein